MFTVVDILKKLLTKYKSLFISQISILGFPLLFWLYILKNNIFLKICYYLISRTSQDLHLIDLRKEIQTQCNKNEIPKSYVFLKSVGRAFAKVKPLQEQELKVKHFLPFQVRNSFSFR